MWKLVQKPFEKETLDDWAKLSADLAKVAIVAMPVVLYGNYELVMKVINIFLLSIVAYGNLCISREFRKIRGEL